MHGRGRSESDDRRIAAPRGGVGGDGVLLVPARGRPFPEAEAIRAAIAERRWRLVETADPAAAMARLVLAGLALRERSGWGLAAERDLVVVFATDDPRAEAELIRACDAHLPHCRRWKAGPDGDLIGLPDGPGGHERSENHRGEQITTDSGRESLASGRPTSHSPPGPVASAELRQSASASDPSPDHLPGVRTDGLATSGGPSSDPPALRLTGVHDAENRDDRNAPNRALPPPSPVRRRSRRPESGLAMTGDARDLPPEPAPAQAGGIGTESADDPVGEDERITAEELAMLFDHDPAPPPSPRGDAPESRG